MKLSLGFECCLQFLLELSFICKGWCCTMGSATTQKTAPVPGWALNTCLEKLWKHLVTNGMRALFVFSHGFGRNTKFNDEFSCLSYPSRLYCPDVYSIVPLHSVCHHGYFNCSYSPCPAVCTVYSDRHYHTFDGLEYDYHSDCQVYLLKVSSYTCN